VIGLYTSNTAPRSLARNEQANKGLRKGDTMTDLTREQWAEDRRRFPRIPDHCDWSTRPKPASDALTDYISTFEFYDLMVALKQAWNDFGREVKAAAANSGAKLELSSKRHELNCIIKYLQKEHPRLPLYYHGRLAREELVAMVPLIDAIEARYEAAHQTAKVAYDQWWQANAVADTSDEAWAAELRQRQEREERNRKWEEERAAYAANYEERQRKRHEEAIARGVAKRARRREGKFREAVQALRDNALRPGSYCRCCKKDLTDPVSIARGIGPECWQQVLNWVEFKQTKAEAGR
jgi:hypothetical protein